MKYNWMVTVNLDEDGDIIMECSQCDHSSSVPIRLAQSVFWDCYAGQTLLIMIEHFRAKHK